MTTMREAVRGVGCVVCKSYKCSDDHSDDEDPIEVEGCGAVLTVVGKRRRVVCNMVKGEGHGVSHKRIGRTGKVLHSWPMSDTQVLDDLTKGLPRRPMKERERAIFDEHDRYLAEGGRMLTHDEWLARRASPSESDPR